MAQPKRNALGADHPTPPLRHTITEAAEIIIIPALADHALPHVVNVERLVVGVAMD